MFRHVSKRVKKFWASVALLSVEMIVVTVLFLAAVVGFVFITRRVFILGNETFDQQVFQYLEQHVSERNNDIMLFFTFLGTHKFLIPANLILIAYFLFIRRHRWYSIKVPAIAISSLALMSGLKNLFGRERPLIPLLNEARGLSFPSGHALMSVTFYGLMIYIVWHQVRNPTLKWSLILMLALLILTIGFSRIYLRVHYATDVIAGFSMGILWLVLAVSVLRRMEKFSRRNLDPVVQQPPEPTTP